MSFNNNKSSLSNFDFSRNKGSNPNSPNLSSQIEKTRSNIQQVVRKAGRNFNRAKSRALANTRRRQSNINTAMSRQQPRNSPSFRNKRSFTASTNSPNLSNSSNSTLDEGNGILYFLLGILVIIMIGVIMLMIYYVVTDCPDKKTLYDYILDPTSPCANGSIPRLPSRHIRPEDPKGSSRPGIDIDIKLPTINEVFHISNQDYTFDQAKCKCAAYGARLATKDEVTEAYNKGANWCSYGWSTGQNAFYPTQRSSWEKLQSGDPKYRNDCGKPGVNGGFFANPNVKFGVNCYGIRPTGRVVHPITPREPPFCEKKTNFQSSHKLETDRIAPFNPNQWNQ